MTARAPDLRPAWRLADRIRPARRADPSLDYCLWPYDPPALPGRDSWQSSALLYQSFEAAGLGGRMIAVCDALLEANGPFRTVWGVKHAAGRLSWEFYFYDYARTARRFDTRAFAAAVGGIVPVAAPLTGDGRPYFMFSVELTAEHDAGRAAVEQFDLYIGNPGSTLSSGLCYGLSAAGFELRNLYFFFDAATQREEIEGKIAATAQIPQSGLLLADLLWPEQTAQTIVVANKRHADSVYFSRIPSDQLVLCLDRLGFPEELRRFARANSHRFAHLLFDVGYDWTAAPGGRPTFGKGSFYGLL